MLEPIAWQPWGGDRHAILTFALRFARRLRRELIYVDNQLVGSRPLQTFSRHRGLIDTTRRDRVLAAGDPMITKLPLVSCYRR
jgi:hypothetical protein